MEYEKKVRLRNRIVDAVVFIVLLAGVSAVTLVLFYRQTMGNPGYYHSDMKAYILEMQGLESGYQFPYPIFFKLGALIHLFAPPELSVAIATMLLNSLGMIVTKLAFNHLTLRVLEDGLRLRQNSKKSGKDLQDKRLQQGGPAEIKHFERSSDIARNSDIVRSSEAAGRSDRSWLAGIMISIVVICLFFVSMLYPPSGIYLPGIRFIYLGVFTANPFHNATFMAARPFAVLAFLWYVKLLSVYEEGVHRVADYVLFAVFLLLATMTKPSFTLVMVSTAGLIMLYRLFRTKFRNFIPTVQLGLCFVPTFLDLLYQFRGVFVPVEGEEGGLGFCFGEVWMQYTSNIVLAVGLAVGFPLLVLVLNYKECRKNTTLCFSWQFYLVSFAEAFFLYEKGFRKFDFNFSWGYMYGIFFCHFCALLLLVRKTAEMMCGRAGLGTTGSVQGSGNVGISIMLLAVQWLAFFSHVVCGLFYFKTIFGGAMYY